MWIAVVITLVASLVGIQSMLAQASFAATSDASVASMLAANMAIYRAGVMNTAGPEWICIGGGNDASAVNRQVRRKARGKYLAKKSQIRLAP